MYLPPAVQLKHNGSQFEIRILFPRTYDAPRRCTPTGVHRTCGGPDEIKKTAHTRPLTFYPSFSCITSGRARKSSLQHPPGHCWHHSRPRPRQCPCPCPHPCRGGHPRRPMPRQTPRRHHRHHQQSRGWVCSARASWCSWRCCSPRRTPCTAPVGGPASSSTQCHVGVTVPAHPAAQCGCVCV